MEKGRTVWHASRFDIPRPTIVGRQEGDNHANSGLGIFCVTQPMDYLSGFGDFIHELGMKSDLRALQMSVSELSRLGRESDADRQWFEQEGRRLAEHYDVIELIEITGIAEQLIILRDDAIVSSRPVSMQEFETFSIDHSQYQRQRMRR